MNDEQFVSLETLGRGSPGEVSAAIQLFNLEWQKVLDNCLDPNTDTKPKRSVTLKVTIVPDDDRELCKIEISATSKLASIRPHPTQVFLGRDRGRAVAVEHDPKQLNVFRQIEEEKTKQADNVRPFARQGGEE